MKEDRAHSSGRIRSGRFLAGAGPVMTAEMVEGKFARAGAFLPLFLGRVVV
jgi:hypothetical protein